MGLVGKILPFALLVVGFTVLAIIAYVVYSIVQDIADKTSKEMQRHNVNLGKDGVRIGVQEIKNERYVDRTQRYVCHGCVGHVGWNQAALMTSNLLLLNEQYLSANLSCLPFSQLSRYYAYLMLGFLILATCKLTVQAFVAQFQSPYWFI